MVRRLVAGFQHNKLEMRVTRVFMDASLMFERHPGAIRRRCPEQSPFLSRPFNHNLSAFLASLDVRSRSIILITFPLGGW
ncbi:MAG: hypothetical protein M2R45_03526 [Verrucomicrobia subdivision 3 bacterium]|nr:hypothetical protein [Limisphaerales bacterium]MCS1415923.1 hypothetical protein [Limisphaerales bacterium]